MKGQIWLLLLRAGWAQRAVYVAVSLICLPRYSIQHQDRLEGRGGGVAIVYKNPLDAARLSALVIPGLEVLHVSVDGFGIVLVYCAPRNPALSLPELVGFVSAAMLRSPRLLDLRWKPLV